MPDEVRVPINSDADIVEARQRGRAFAAEIGFNGGTLTLIATAISEIARNIVQYAQQGEIVMHWIQKVNKQGIEIIAHDDGPGIPDISLALQDGYSTRRSLGLGLPGTRRLMDEFDIVSNGEGTTVTIKKWLR